MARKGEKLSPELKERIREANIRRFKERVASFEAQPEVKPCSRCGVVKSVADFYHTKRKLSSGVIAVFPQQPCKECKRAAVKVERERLIEQGEYYERKWRYEQQLPRERRLARKREWEAGRRRRNGARPRQKETPEDRDHVSVAPISAFLVAFLERTEVSRAEIADRTGVSERALYRVEHRTAPTVRLDTVDKILTGLDCSEELNVLYPLEEPEKLVGYHYLDPEGVLDVTSSTTGKISSGPARPANSGD